MIYPIPYISEGTLDFPCLPAYNSSLPRHKGTNMKIAIISDLHGELPKVPACDLLLIAGDITPATREYHRQHYRTAYWFDTVFRWWLETIKTRKTVMIAGNHDFIFQDHRNMLPNDLPLTYLEDQHFEWEGLKIWGTPWQPIFYDWAFNLSEEELDRKFSAIPDGIDILVSHGPPLGYCDLTFDQRSVGSYSLLKHVERTRPNLVACGHIHYSYGSMEMLHKEPDARTLVVNASVLGEDYKLQNKPIVVDTDGWKVLEQGKMEK